MIEQAFESTRSYGCSNGCGNPYDVILINIKDLSSDALCMPCFVHVATGVIEAMTNAGSPEVQAALAYAASVQGEQVPGPSGRPGRRNAPANSQDASMFEAYDTTVEWDGNPETAGG